MERSEDTRSATELRTAFFAEVHRDPYAHMLANVYADAWADAYERALRDAIEVIGVPCDGDHANVYDVGGLKRAPQALVDLVNRKTHSELRNDALEHLTDERNKAQAEFLVALAAVGSLLPRPKL